MNRSTPGLPVHHQLPEFTQTHVHQISDAIQPSHPLSSPSPQCFPASGSFQMSQLFASGGQSIGVSTLTPVLPMNTQDWSPLGRTGLLYTYTFTSLSQQNLWQAYPETGNVLVNRVQWWTGDMWILQLWVVWWGSDKWNTVLKMREGRCSRNKEVGK